MTGQIFYAKAIDGALVFDNKQGLFNHLCGIDKQKLIVRIDKEKHKRTLSQNRYYFHYLEVISKETGENVRKLHNFFPRTLLPPVFENVLGTEYRRPKSTTELNKAEFAEYLDKICAMTNVPLPDPKLLTAMYGESPEYPTNKLNPTF